MKPVETEFEGLTLYPRLLDETAQKALAAELVRAFERAPPYRPKMPRTGKPWSIRQTNFGALGWVSRPQGYGYAARDEVNDAPWPAIPEALLALWREVAAWPAPPECCLVNLYEDPKARMGLHRDEDEAALDAPVVSLSLGDTCVFRVGGFARGDKSKSFRLSSGDVLVMGGASRLRFHGVDRVISGSRNSSPAAAASA